MNIALLGYGKMGKTIETIAQDRNHTIVYKTSSAIDVEALKKADVAIDFSVPSAAFQNITTCFKNNIPVICGTTGWLKDYDKAVELCKKNNGAFLYASNFSIGMNLFFELNSTLATMMSNMDDYSISLEEIHHTQKLDKPSGTAITLAEQVIEKTKLTDWFLTNEKGEGKKQSLPVTALREEDVPGTHTIKYSSAIDTIEITHTAHSRKGFAQGAVIAAEWIKGKNGNFSMKDVLKHII